MIVSRETPAIARREREVLEQLQTGRSAPEVARALGISRSTVKWYRARAYAKFGISSRAQLVAVALPAPRDLRRERIRRPPRARRIIRVGDSAMCARCGRDFRRWQRQLPSGRGRFCSNQCSAAARGAAARAGAEVRRCLVCARPFVPHHRDMRHCSRACSRVTIDAKIRELGRARRLPPAEKLERLRAQWREAKRRRRGRLVAAAALHR